MKIVIVGVGAMGSTFGRRRHEAGEDVYLLYIWAGHMQAINRDGLWLEGVNGDRLHQRGLSAAGRKPWG